MRLADLMVEMLKPWRFLPPEMHLCVPTGIARNFRRASPLYSHMATRDLRKAEKRIAQARANIASLHQAIQTYKNAGDDAGAAGAHEQLSALEQTLAVLL